MKNTTNHQLDNHALPGKWKGYNSINITDDYRLIFINEGKDRYTLIDFGTHDQLYRKR